MKKTISIVLVVILMLAMSVTAFAATPRWSNTAGISPNISFVSNIYSTDVIGNSGASSISCTMVLYEKGWFGSYTEVSRTSQSAPHSAYTFIGNYTYQSGKTYKLEATSTVYLNGTAETITSSCEKKA